MRVPAFLLGLIMLAASAGSGAAQTTTTCSKADFSRIVNETGAALRKLSADNQPKLQADLRRLKAKRGWSDEQEQQQTEALFADATSDALDERTTRLLSQLDKLADSGDQAAADCSRLEALKATAKELRETVQAKTEHVRRKLNAALLDAGVPLAPAAKASPQPPRPPVAATPKAPPAQPRVAQPPPLPIPPVPPTTPRIAQSPPASAPPVPPAKAPPSAGQAPTPSWSTNTAPPPIPAPIPPTEPTAGTTYSIDEIRSAARNVFGTVSTSLASVIEYAFSRTGRPTGYIVGREGGAAFLAGVRYGRGQLYLKGQPPLRVYWHGPSIGYDIGAAGSQTLILVYNVTDPVRLYSGYTGIDGSAYLVGGVGVTFLTDGRGIMAPIRSGLGVRFGASIGYLRFTPQPTWNPF